MAESHAEQLQFRPKARIIRTIGDQLISGPEAALIELVKNAYDADATYVSVKFIPPLVEGGGRIVVRDDGHGMTLSDIEEKWMEPATSSKQAVRVSPLTGRTMMGSKGIGRFAAAKLGRLMALTSISNRTGSLQAVLIPEIDWSIFNGDAYLSDIRIDYLVHPSEGPPGTEIEIRELNVSWNQPRVERLHLELRRLVSPLAPSNSDSRFKIFLDLSECRQENAGFDGAALIDGALSFERLDDEEAGEPFEVRPFPLLTTSDYEVQGQFDAAGKFTGTMQIRRADQVPRALNLELPLKDDEVSCGEVEVRFHIFDRDTDVIKRTMSEAGLGSMTATQARKLVDDIAGVAIYRDGFRVRPYGDAENDWLTLDSRRVQDPSRRIGRNQVAGYVTVQGQAESGLEERSSREGFEDNPSFRRLHRLISELLTREVEPLRFSFRESAGLSRKRRPRFAELRELSALERIRSLVGQIPPAERALAEAVIDREAKLLGDRIDDLEERHRVLEASSSLGNIVGEVLHEGSPAAAFLAKGSLRLQKQFPDLLAGGDAADRARADFPEWLSLMRGNAEKLAELFTNLRPLAGGRRGPPRQFRPADPISSARGLFRSHDIAVTIHGAWDVKDILGYPEDLHTAMVNLIGNSIYWLEDSKTKEPRIDIRLSNNNRSLVILVEDNGPGIREEFAEQVFDVGFSLKLGGTGLGLNIAREALARSGGSLFFHPDYDQGTRFEIRFAVPES